MLVRELIAQLATMPQDVHVVAKCCSEWVILTAASVEVMQLQAARNDGWVANARPDRPLFDYVAIEG